MSEADWNQILDTNVTGMFGRSDLCAVDDRARRGRLIGVASLASFVGLQEVAAYTRAGRGGRTDPRAVSRWARHGVTVNAIAPGVFETDLNREILKGARGQEFKLRTPMAASARRRARRRRDLSRLGSGQLRHRPADCGGRRLPGERCQSMNPAIVISAQDNVATALEALDAARRFRRDVGGRDCRGDSARPQGGDPAIREGESW